MSELPKTPEEWLALRQETVNNIKEIVTDVGGLPSVLLSYQQKSVALLDTVGVNVLVIEKSRRIGETWGLASAAVLRAARARKSGGMDVMYISYSQEMTREFIDACAMWAKAISVATLDTGEFLFDDEDENGEKRSIQAFRIRFASGYEIVGLSSAPRSLRGKQGLVIIDEAAFVESLSELLKAALAFLMWGGQVVVCSTHNGTDNPFNQLVQDILAGRSKYTHQRIDFDDALAAGLYKRICLVKHQEWTAEGEKAWRDEIVSYYGDGAEEELFCVPAQGTGAWLSGPLIESRMTGDDCEILRLTLPANYLQLPLAEQKGWMTEVMDRVKRACDKLDPERQHALGFDFGRHIDLSVMPVLEIGKTLKRKAKLTIEMRAMPYKEQEVVVSHVLSVLPRPVGACFDATGSGEYISEAMARKYGFAAKEPGEPGGLIAQIKLSQEWYRLNMPPVKAAFEDDSLILAKDDEHVADLRLVKVIRGIAQIPQARTVVAGGMRHGDFAVGLALAYLASRMRYVEYGYQAVAAPARQAEPRYSDRPDHSSDYRLGRGDDEYRQPLGARLPGSI